jgi:hypothetical protein
VNSFFAIGEEFVCAMLLVQLLIDDTEDAHESVAVEAEQFVSIQVLKTENRGRFRTGSI